jgi:myo-inositol catabolism protein IolC
LALPLRLEAAIMSIGYDQPLYLLPFDHRASYVAGMFKFTLPLTTGQHDAVVDSKQVVYDGFREALGSGVPVSRAGILVDEEFGAGILRDATRNGYTTALSVEKSGSDEFEFEYGDAFAEHIAAFDSTFAKVLVRYNPEDDAALNWRQTVRLKQLSDYCRGAEQRFMFELLVPATKAQLDRVQADTNAYDLRVRPDLMVRTIRDLQDSGIEPDIWKIEGLDRREACERVVEIAQRDGRRDVGCIVLGRGADEKKVTEWLQTAASVPGFIGFAVGRTTFWDAVADYEAGKATRQEATCRIATRYREWVNVFERAQPSLAREPRGEPPGVT